MTPHIRLHLPSREALLWPVHFVTHMPWRAMFCLLLVALLVYTIHFAGSFLDYGHQIGLGWAVFAMVYFLHRTDLAQRQPWRIVFILLVGFLALRYFLWRSFDTLVYTGPLDFPAMMLLYLAELYAITVLFMGLFINAWPLAREIAPLAPSRTDLPVIDILIPTYNEPDDIVLATATAATQLDYPREKLRIWICDDGATHAKRSHPETGMEAWDRHFRLRRIADSLGIGYLTRENNRHAKAGNINHAMRHTSGELILVLDCDHVPTHDFLRNTVSYFLADPKLFLVQTPHFFINPCPIEKNLEGVADPSGENDMFYRTVHPAMDAWNASYFCGSAALLRRSCLEEIGGISGNTITEDAETAFRLHSRGYNSIYVNRPMVCGLSPETFDDYVIQRSRWAQGMVQLVLLDNPLFQKGLTLPQRIAYFNASYFWFFGFSRFIYYVAPACFLIFGLNVYDASWLQILAYALPFVLSTFVVMNCFYKGTREPLFSEIYESVQSMFLIPSVISALLHPHKPTFKVTPKGGGAAKNYLSPMSAPFFIVIAVNFAALLTAAYKWTEEALLRDVITVTGVWCVYNLALALVSLGAFWERKQVRKFHRINIDGPVAVHFPRMKRTLRGRVENVSLSGVGLVIEPDFKLAPKERVVIAVRDSYGKKYRFESAIMRSFPRGDKMFCGTEFIETLVSYPSVVSFMFGDSQRWVENWRRKAQKHGSARMLWYFLGKGIAGVTTCAVLLLRQAATALVRFLRKWMNAAYLRDAVVAGLAWVGFQLYIGTVHLIEVVERRRARKFRRIAADGSATIDFPMHNARVFAHVCDVSLTGVGVEVDLPFELKDKEPVTVDMKDREGHAYHLDCTIRRATMRNGHTLCGVEFLLNLQTFPQIVRYVYGMTLRDLVLHSMWEQKHGH